MINRKDAEAAAELLGIEGDYDEEAVKAAYKRRAFETHPDKGGDPHAFAAVDRAKHVLIMWLARAPEGVSTPSIGGHCGVCDGKGYVRVQRGFRSMSTTCARCRGTGDTQYEHERNCGD